MTKMWIAFVVPLLATLALPATAMPEPPTKVLAARQSVVTPPPCKAISPPPTAAETEQRFNTFADEFLVKKNLTAAFEFVSSTYIVREVSPALQQSGLLTLFRTITHSLRTALTLPLTSSVQCGQALRSKSYGLNISTLRAF